MNFAFLVFSPFLTLRALRRLPGAAEPMSRQFSASCETFIGTGEFAGSEVEGLGTLLQKQGAKAVLDDINQLEDALNR